jgi:hypothetical protein
MAVIQFTQVGDTDLYLSAGAAAVRPFGLLASISLPSPISLADAWLSDPAGVFFSLSAPLADGATWAAVEPALRNWLQNAGAPESDQRMLWVELGGENGATPLQVLPLCVTIAKQISTLSQSTPFDFKGYLVDLPLGAVIGPSPGGDSLRVIGSTVFSRDGSPPASYPLVRGIVDIPVTGSAAGGLLFSVNLSADGSDEQATDFERLDIGIRYGWPAGAVGVDYYHVPTADQPTGTTTLWASLLPFDSQAAPASRFSFLPLSGPQAAAPVMTSSFVTPQGRQIALTPVANTGDGARPGGLVFGRQPLFSPDQADAPYSHYLTFDGDFTIAPVGGTVPASGLRIVCGLGVMEHVSGAMPAALSFTPGPAFLPAPGGALTDLATTAWVTPGGVNGTAFYYAQPEAAPFYGGEISGWEHGGTQFIDLVDVPSAVLPSSPRPFSTLPMLGYAGLGDDATAAAISVEQLILGPARAGVVALAPVAAPPSPLPSYGLTPQGLIVGFDPASLGDWAWMGVGNVAGTAQPDIVFTGVKPDFQHAMQNAAPFVVLANPAIVQANSTPSTMTANIDDWVFDLAPDSWTPGLTGEVSSGPRPQGVMIIKMDRTTSIQTWIDQLSASAWPDASLLPGTGMTLEDTATLLRQSVATAEARRAASADPATSPFAHFLDVMLIEPTWTGTVMLNAAIVSSPADLQAIQAGIKPTWFYAHHVGFQTGLVGLSPTGGLQLRPDRIFGAIDYEDTDDLVLDATSPNDFQFKALQLTVGFERSHVTTFTGRVELFVNRLYSATTRKYPTANGNNLILDGTKVFEAGDDGTIRVGYRFGSSSESDYQLAGSAVQTVSVDDTALSFNASLSTPTVLVSDFVMAGALNFQPVPDFDMFSFGPDMPMTPPASPATTSETLKAPDEIIDTPFGRLKVIGYVDLAAADAARNLAAQTDQPVAAIAGAQASSGLLFTNFIVRMSFDTTTGVTTFSVSEADAAFNLAGSTPRPNGLAGRFPAKPLRFVKGDASVQSPKAMGYAPVTCGVQQALITGPWYGIEYEMELGTLGALANSVGITLTIMAAWGVDQTAQTPPVFLGVSLPGMGLSGFELALQGILKIGFSTIQFDTYTADDGGVGYIMRLRDFGLHILGVNFPSGHISVLIAGAPETTGPSKLGWFAGYVEDNYKPVSRAAIRRRFAGPRPSSPQIVS